MWIKKPAKLCGWFIYNYGHNHYELKIQKQEPHNNTLNYFIIED